MTLSDILSIIAIVVSVIGFFLSRSLDRFLYGPKCRISAYSVPQGLQIQIANVGDRILHIKRVSYTICSDIKNKEDYTHNHRLCFIAYPVKQDRKQGRLMKICFLILNKNFLLRRLRLRKK